MSASAGEPLPEIPPSEFLAAHLPRRVEAGEVRALILETLGQLGWSAAQLDAACADRSRTTSRRLQPGSTSRTLRRLATQATVDVSLADLMLTVCGEHLARLESYVDRADAALDAWEARGE